MTYALFLCADLHDFGFRGQNGTIVIRKVKGITEMETKQCAYPRCQNEALHQCVICERHYCEDHCVNKGGWICWDDWRMRTGSQPSVNLPFFLRSSLYEARGGSKERQAFFIFLYIVVIGLIIYLALR
jgi:hypothetical protein